MFIFNFATSVLHLHLHAHETLFFGHIDGTKILKIYQILNIIHNLPVTYVKTISLIIPIYIMYRQQQLEGQKFIAEKTATILIYQTRIQLLCLNNNNNLRIPRICTIPYDTK
jgi:hypothetical protein